VCVCVYKKMVNCRMGLTKNCWRFFVLWVFKRQWTVMWALDMVEYYTVQVQRFIIFFYANLKRIPATRAR